jgi:predicted nucleotide-binding protein
LYEEGVELPSDLKGLLYVPYDVGGAWKMLIAKELKAAGVHVDLNKAV